MNEFENISKTFHISGGLGIYSSLGDVYRSIIYYGSSLMRSSIDDYSIIVQIRYNKSIVDMERTIVNMHRNTVSTLI